MVNVDVGCKDKIVVVGFDYCVVGKIVIVVVDIFKVEFVLSWVLYVIFKFLFDFFVEYK